MVKEKKYNTIKSILHIVLLISVIVYFKTKISELEEDLKFYTEEYLSVLKVQGDLNNAFTKSFQKQNKIDSVIIKKLDSLKIK